MNHLQLSYRELDQREEELKRELEAVREQKREITRRIFLVPTPAEALNSIAEANSRAPNGEASNGRSELPAREPLIVQSTLP